MDSVENYENVDGKSALPFLERHFVAIKLELQRGSEAPKTTILSAFVMSVRGHWFLITAGHSIAAVERAEEDGYAIKSSRLIDCIASDAPYKNSIPFPFQKPYFYQFGDEFDFGGFYLSSQFVGLLMANNIQPLDEDVWKKQPPEVDALFLCGIPTDRVIRSDDQLSFVLAHIPIDPLYHVPPGFPNSAVPMFYARLISGRDILSSVVGMSGGPIFAFHRNDRGELLYWLVAIQSTWMESQRTIKAFPALYVGEAIESAMDQLDLYRVTKKEGL